LLEKVEIQGQHRQNTSYLSKATLNPNIVVAKVSASFTSAFVTEKLYGEPPSSFLHLTSTFRT